MQLILTSVYLLCVAAVFGQQETCVWEVNQGFDPAFLDGSATYFVNLPDVHEDDECKQRCCENDDCRTALIGSLTDGQPECFLVNCTNCNFTPSSQFKSYGKSQETEVLPETRSSSLNATVYCRFQKAVGPCRASFPRFYYNVVNQTCEQFYYGGCRGNINNFVTLEDCEADCAGVTGDVIVDTLQKRRMAGYDKTEDNSPKASLPEMTSAEFAESCQAEPKVGPCRASMPRFYYKDGVCVMFRYGGCKGNKNNYPTEQECMKSCTVKIVDPTKDDDEDDIKSYEDACTVQPDSGRCRAAFQMFYYEPTSQTCLQFTYGGCGGNKNRYDTVEECMSKCAEKHGSFDGHGHARSRWTPAFFLVATLAIMSIVLLVGLLLISSRRARPQLITLDDKQELLPEEHHPAEELPKQVSS